MPGSNHFLRMFKVSLQSINVSFCAHTPFLSSLAHGPSLVPQRLVYVQPSNSSFRLPIMHEGLDAETCF